MDDLQQITQYLQAIGPENDDISGILQTADSEWQVVFDEHMQVQLTYHAATRKLLLSIELGMPPSARRLEVLETLLSCNLLSHENGGVRMALIGPEGEATQLIDLEFGELNAALLSTVLRNFSTLAYSWKMFVQSAAAVSTGTQPSMAMMSERA